VHQECFHVIEDQADRHWFFRGREAIVRSFLARRGRRLRVLDVGCGKGFFLHDVKAALPNSSVTGIDIARYAIENAMDDIKPFVIVCDCRALPYADHVFDFVLSITTIHNVHYSDCKKALQEIERVGKKHKFVVVDAYRNEEEKERLYKWNLTAQTMMHVDDWKELFKEAGYTGDYYWFIA